MHGETVKFTSMTSHFTIHNKVFHFWHCVVW